MHTFISQKPPLRSYKSMSKSLNLLADVASQLPKLLLTNKVQEKIKKLNKNSFSIDILLKKNSEKEINLAMSHLSFIAHAYIWGGGKPEKVLPEVRLFNFVLTKAGPLPGLTCKNSITLKIS